MNKLLPAIRAREGDGSDAAALVEQWYLHDTNANVYVLQPSSLVSGGEWWGSGENKGIFPRLQEYLRTAANAVLSPDQARAYTISVTEDEFEKGAVGAPDRDTHVLVFRRHLEGIENSIQWKKTGSFMDRKPDGTADEEAQAMLSDLRDKRVPELIKPEHVKTYSVPWGPGMSVEQHGAYLREFCDEFTHYFIDSMNQAAARFNIAPHEQFDEVSRHLLAAKKISASYVLYTKGKSVCERIENYLGSLKPRYPLLITGMSGAGKTSTLGHAFIQTTTKFNPGMTGPVCIIRFIGKTYLSGNIRPLLNSICTQIGHAYGREALPATDYQALSRQFKRVYLRLATKERPIYLFIDSLDQLGDDDGGPLLDWLPVKLPPYVRVVLSTNPQQGETHDLLKERVPSDGDALLTAWLAADNHSLTTQQRDFLLTKFTKKPVPLFLKVAYGTAREWRSYTREQDQVLGETVIELVHEVFNRLEAEHGKVLMSAALGLITASKNGLSNQELIDILSCDEEVLDDVFEWWTPPVRRLPPLLWTRLQSDINRSLIRRGADGGVLLWGWDHIQFMKTARKRYLMDDPSHWDKRRTQIVEYFQGTWADIPKPFKTKDGKELATIRHVPPQPLVTHEVGGERTYNLRALSEIPYGLIGCKRWADAENYLCDIKVLQAMLDSGRIYEVIGMYAQIMEEAPSQRLSEYIALLGNRTHVLMTYPALLCQAGMYSHPTSSVHSDFAKYLADHPQHPYLEKCYGNPEQPPACELVLAGHAVYVQSVAVSHGDQSMIASVGGCGDLSVKLWTLATGSQVWTMEAFTEDPEEGASEAGSQGKNKKKKKNGLPGGWPSDVCFTPNNEFIIIAGSLGNVQVRRCSTGRMVAQRDMYAEDYSWPQLNIDMVSEYSIAQVYRYEIAPLFARESRSEKDRQIFVSGGLDGNIVISAVVEDKSSNVEVHVLHESGPTDDPIVSLTVSPDTQYIATGHHKGTIKLWKVVDNGETKVSLEASPFKVIQHDCTKQEFSISKLAFSNNVKYLVTAPRPAPSTEYGREHTGGEHIYVWSVPEFEVLARIEHDLPSATTRGIAWTPNDDSFWFTTDTKSLKQVKAGAWTLGKRFADKLYEGSDVFVVTTKTGIKLITSAWDVIALVNSDAHGEEYVDIRLIMPTSVQAETGKGVAVGGAVTLSRDDKHVYIPCYHQPVAAPVYVYDAASFSTGSPQVVDQLSEVKNQGWSSVLSSDGRWYSCSSWGGIVVSDILGKRAIVPSAEDWTKSGLVNAETLCIAPDDKTLFVADHATLTKWTVDIDAGTMAFVCSASAPQVYTMTADDRFLYVSAAIVDPSTSFLHVLDPSSLQVLKHFPGSSPASRKATTIISVMDPVSPSPRRIVFFANTKDEVVVFATETESASDFKRRFNLVIPKFENDIIYLCLSPNKDKLMIATRHSVSMVYPIRDIGESMNQRLGHRGVPPPRLYLLPSNRGFCAQVSQDGQKVWTTDGIEYNPWQWHICYGEGRNGLNMWD